MEYFQVVGGAKAYKDGCMSRMDEFVCPRVDFFFEKVMAVARL